MTDIRSYRREKEKREQNRINYRDKIMKHKLTSVYRVLLIMAVVAAIMALVMIQYKRHVYTGYDIVSTEPLESSSGTEDIRLKDSVLTYSKDGAHCTNAKGQVTWNQTYEIQDIILSRCKDVVAIGSYNGREIYIQDSVKQLGTVTTNMPIRDIAVSATGRVAVVISDTDVMWINTYDATGEMRFSGQAHMKEAGYPVAISLSPNGMLLAVCYVYVDAGMLKTNVVFYNFGPVGENMSDLMVSSWSYTDMLIPEIRFVDDETAFAVGDSRLTIFKGSQTPTDIAGYFYNNKEIRSVFYGDQYIGLVMSADDMEHNYVMDVYSTKGEKTDSYYFDIEYSDIFFEEDCFVVYNEAECMIMTYDGIEKYNGYFSKAVDLMIPTGTPYKYLLVTENSIDTIQLK